MSFSDNIENDLKNLERAEERDPAAIARRQAEKEAGRAAALAAAPHAEQLRRSPFTTALLDQAVLLGHQQRIKVSMAWVGSALRLQARDHYLELRPGREGVQARFLHREKELAAAPVDFAGDAQELARRWLAVVTAGEDR